MKNTTVLTFKLLDAICLKHLSTSNANDFAREVVHNLNILEIPLTVLLTYLDSKQIESLEELYYVMKDIEYEDKKLKRR